MKTLKTLLLAISIIASYTVNAQVAVTTDGSSADPSAMLDVKSTTKGFLPPRMTGAERDAISNPATWLIIICTDCGDNGEAQIYNGTAWTNMIGGTASTAVPTVTNPTTGRIWMDRNLGASQVATSSTDADAYGDLYQWGRGTDGHQIRTSGTTTTLSSSDNPGNGNFILASTSPPYDWRSPQNDNLWQGVSGSNNPCPSGFRLPTQAEWEAERASWGSNNAAGAFASPLKLPVAGFRNLSDGSLNNVGASGGYWSSAIDGTNSREFFFHNSGAYMLSQNRAHGFSVRCIKE